MFTHTPGASKKAWTSKVDDDRPFSDVYFSYSSNLSPSTMKGRHPSSLFCGLAKLTGWKWQINSTRYANIIPASEEDSIYGSLYFLSPADEAAMDEAEGVPYHYQKQHHEVVRVNGDGSETEQRIPALMYIDAERKEEGDIMPDYIVWIRKAIRDAKPFGLPDDYVERVILPWLPEASGDEVEEDMNPIRIMFSSNQMRH
jgi:gamma-glutamylcyclotransferase